MPKELEYLHKSRITWDNLSVHLREYILARVDTNLQDLHTEEFLRIDKIMIIIHVGAILDLSKTFYINSITE